MNWREKRYYIVEMRYRKNGFLMDEVYYAVSGLRRPMMPERERKKGDVRRVARWMCGMCG